MGLSELLRHTAYRAVQVVSRRHSLSYATTDQALLQRSQNNLCEPGQTELVGTYALPRTWQMTPRVLGVWQARQRNGLARLMITAWE